MMLSIPQIVLMVLFFITLIIIGYKMYTILFIKSESEIAATTNKFNNMHHRSEFDKSVSYHTLDSA